MRARRALSIFTETSPALTVTALWPQSRLYPVPSMVRRGEPIISWRPIKSRAPLAGAPLDPRGRKRQPYQQTQSHPLLPQLLTAQPQRSRPPVDLPLSLAPQRAGPEEVEVREGESCCQSPCYYLPP